LLLFSGLMSETPLDMILWVFAAWDWRSRDYFLVEGEYVEYSFNLKWFLTGLDKHAQRVRVLNTHPRSNRKGKVIGCQISWI
jgi:hypothetical protein